MGRTDACRKCRFWDGGCRLIQESRLNELLDSGPCKPWSLVEGWVDRFLKLRTPACRSRREDLLQDLQLFLRSPKFRFPRNFVPDAGHLRTFLRTVVLNRTHDFLRKERLAPKLRCGACLYYGKSSTCTRATCINQTGSEIPNPHWGRSLDPNTTPASLKPPCDGFFWRHRPVALDEISNRLEEGSTGGNLAKEEAAKVLTLAISQLMLRGPSGRRQAYAVKGRFILGETASDISKKLDVSEKTVNRDIEAGLEALRDILRNRYGLEAEDMFTG